MLGGWCLPGRWPMVSGMRSSSWLCLTLAALIALPGCSYIPRTPHLRPLPFAVDTARTQKLENGVAHHYIYSSKGPWAIHVLDVDLDRCYSPVAVKGAAGAAGRTKTSLLLSDLDRRERVI